ncbi:MAG: N-acetylmuramoyl-L-alanine amidase, partial [Candidatus Hydrogenedentes bacterium]|nr:N-acetylmuramoyl-L-alanine amidase [Candidatus Hydrogenedentota bacterium]
FTYAFKLDVRTGAPAAQPTAPPATAGGRLRVVLDAGHGGADPGVTGQSGTPEKAIARAIADRVAKLIGASCQAAFTRAEDNAPTVADRVSMANVALKGDVLVSIHTGASAAPTASGFEFFCPMGSGDTNSSRSLALARAMSNTMAQSTGVAPRGLHQAPCRLFTNLQIPGVLIEVGFVTNPKEEPLLVNAEYQDKLAQGIANGILAYAGGKAQ